MKSSRASSKRLQQVVNAEESYYIKQNVDILIPQIIKSEIFQLFYKLNSKQEKAASCMYFNSNNMTM